MTRVLPVVEPCVGETEVIPAFGTVKLNAPGAVPVPPPRLGSVVTKTVTEPDEWAGVVTFKVVVPVTVIDATVAALPPNKTADTSAVPFVLKWVPWTTTLAPPVDVPCAGVTEETVGRGATKLKAPAKVALAPVFALVDTLTVVRPDL